MRIALLTIWHDGNYGAEMQAYATIKILRSLGHDVKMINLYLNDSTGITFRNRINNTISSIFPARLKFNHFWKQYIPTTRYYNSIQELKDNPPKADIYIVGSDQVWNPDITKGKKLVFFLNFGDDSIKRIAYGSSFGTDTWKHPELTEDIKKLLNGFSAISCRESSGINILKNIFNVDATHVLDPTLLFNSYPELVGNVKQLKTLVYYPLSSNPQLTDYAKHLAKKLGLSACNANRVKLIPGSKIVWNKNSIEGWIKDLAGATFIITTSFHGIAFSLLYHRQFAVLITNKTRSTRITSLLSSLELEDRIYHTLNELDSAKPWTVKIDYKKIDEKLNIMRNFSIQYLKQAITQ